MIDWSAIDTVLLDMDGTLLDLHFDNHFWLEHLPKRYAEKHGLHPERTQTELHTRYDHLRGKLQWYCLDYWREELGMDIVSLKKEVQHLIRVHPHVIDFLDYARADGKRVLLVTNAHRDSLMLKLERTPLGGHVDEAVCSHDYGLPKEHLDFWAALQADHPFAPSRTLLVDDNLAVLASARDFGIRWLLGVRQPDTQKPPVTEAQGFEVLNGFDALLPGGALRS